MDGCSTRGYIDVVYISPQKFNGAERLAELQCCSNDGTSCVRKNPNSGECWSGDNDDAKVTWFEAEHICTSNGMRLCKSQAELDLCCVSGCSHDSVYIWTNQVAGATLRAAH